MGKNETTRKSVDEKHTQYKCVECGDMASAPNWDTIVEREKKCELCLKGIPKHKRGKSQLHTLRRERPNAKKNKKKAQKQGKLHKFICLNTEECGITHMKPGHIWYCPDCGSQVKKYS